jgi:hypothetical protein
VSGIVTSTALPGVKGVSEVPSGRFTSEIKLHGEERKHLGKFDTVEEAKRAYDTVAKAFYGEFLTVGTVVRKVTRSKCQCCWTACTKTVDGDAVFLGDGYGSRSQARRAVTDGDKALKLCNHRLSRGVVVTIEGAPMMPERYLHAWEILVNNYDDEIDLPC